MAISLITPHDIRLLHTIEDAINTKLKEYVVEGKLKFWENQQKCKIVGSHSSVAEDESCLGCDCARHLVLDVLKPLLSGLSSPRGKNE
jgi:hypothetical protein